MANRKKDKKSCCSRRQILSMGLAAPFLCDPVKMLVSGILNGLVNQAEAQTTGSQPRNYIYIALSGGAPRWFWDLPLSPYSNSSLLPLAQVSTRFAANGSTGGLPEYATAPITVNGVTLNMPWLWTSNIPTSSGGSVPMSSLLANMVMIRGVNLGNDGHPANADKMLFPNTAGGSLDGLVADQSTAPVPAVSIDPAPVGAYRSLTGVGTTEIGASSNPLAQILSPFDTSKDALSSTFLSRRAAMETAVNSALATLGNYANSANPGASALYSIRGNALQMIRTGIGNAASAYTALYNKYNALMAACATSPVTGITDLPVPYTQFPTDSNGNILETSTTGYNVFVRNADLRTLVQSNSYCSSLAEGFAVAEYLIVNGFSSAVTCGAGAFENLLFENYSALGSAGTVTAQNAQGLSTLDEHFTGAACSLILQTFLFRSLSACLYELIGQLKSANLFNNTVIQIGGDFHRAPTTNGSGSGHGYTGTCTSMLSGIIHKPSVVGNIETSSYMGGGIYATWGHSALTQVSGSPQTLQIGHLTSSVAELLGVVPPLANAPSLFYIDATQGVLPTIPLATNV